MNCHLRILVFSISILFLFVECTQQKEKLTEKEDSIEDSSGLTEVSETGLAYYIEGCGIPLLVISLSGTEFYQKTFSEEIFKHFQVVIVDLGSEQRPTQEITLDVLMDDLERLRNSLNLGKVAVFGHSGTVLLALEYAKRYPQSTSHLILMAAGPKWWGLEDYIRKQEEHWQSFASVERQEILKRNREKLTDEMLSKATPQEQFLITSNAEAPRYVYDPQTTWDFLFENTIINVDVVYHVWNNVLKGCNQTPYLSKIAFPVFIAMGKYDFQNPPSLWDGVRDKLRNCTYHLFEKSGHIPMLEERELFDKKLIEWISSQ